MSEQEGVRRCRCIHRATYTDARVSASSDPSDPYLDRRLARGRGSRYVGKIWDGTDALATPSNTLVDAMFSFDYGRWRYAVNATNLFR